MNLGLFDTAGAAVTNVSAALTYELQLQPVSAGANGTLSASGAFVLLNDNGGVLQQPNGSITAAGTYELVLVPDNTMLGSVTSDPFTVG